MNIHIIPTENYCINYRQKEAASFELDYVNKTTDAPKNPSTADDLLYRKASIGNNYHVFCNVNNSWQFLCSTNNYKQHINEIIANKNQKNKGAVYNY